MNIKIPNYQSVILRNERRLFQASDLQSKLNIDQAIHALRDEGERNRAKSRQETATKRIGTISEMLKTVSSNIG